FPTIEKLQKDEDGRKKLTLWTRYATAGLALIQAWGYAVFLQITGWNAVINPGFTFLLSTALILTAGAIYVMWLGEQITERGIGNGASLLIFFSIIEGFPGAIGRTIEALTTGVLSVLQLVL